MLLIILLIILSFGVEFPQLYINDSYPDCQFAGLTYTGQCHWYHVQYNCVLKDTYYKTALTMHLPSWRTGLKQIDIQILTRCVTSSTIYLY